MDNFIDFFLEESPEFEEAINNKNWKKLYILSDSSIKKRASINSVSFLPYDLKFISFLGKNGFDVGKKENFLSFIQKFISQLLNNEIPISKFFEEKKRKTSTGSFTQLEINNENSILFFIILKASYIYNWNFSGEKEIYNKYIGHKEKFSTTEKSILYNHRTLLIVDKINIKNYFSLEEINLKNLKDKKEIYFLGENGDGKTILLQAIALALNGQINNSTVYDFIIKNEEFNKEFNKEFKNKDFIATSTLENNEVIKFEDDRKKLDVYDLYKNVYAYSVNRSKTSKNKIENLININYLSLFDREIDFINPNVWLEDLYSTKIQDEYERIKKGDTEEKEYLIDKVIPMLQELAEGEEKLKIKVSGKKVTFIERGTELEFDQLSEGYRSVLVLACDLLARLSANQYYVTKLEDYRGVVLIDEIGAFLHPKWKYSIMKKLRGFFKNIQWFVTTHSPIVTLGASEDAIFYKLSKENGVTKISQPITELKDMTANSMITSLLWRLDEFTTRKISPDAVSDDDYIYQKIHQKISERIKENPLWTDDDVLREIENELDNI